jgi:hypothetical protein
MEDMLYCQRGDCPEQIPMDDGSEYVDIGAAVDADGVALASVPMCPDCAAAEAADPSVLVFTDAPGAYDYGYTTDVGAHDLVIGSRTVPGRLVGIPTDRLVIQSDRYQSGMYVVSVLG